MPVNKKLKLKALEKLPAQRFCGTPRRATLSAGAELARQICVALQRQS